jgi:hypothetical protein
MYVAWASPMPSILPYKVSAFMNRFRCKQGQGCSGSGFKKLAETFFTDAVEKCSHIFEPFFTTKERDSMSKERTHFQLSFGMTLVTFE